MTTEEQPTNRYEYKGKHYYIESSCDMKDPSSRGWFPAVVYVSYESGMRFCRKESEFYELFNFIG